jgi:putative ABC transport system permease protein
MHNRLENFAHPIDICKGIFLIVVGISLAILVFTISFQAIKVALANPVVSLQTK